MPTPANSSKPAKNFFALSLIFLLVSLIVVGLSAWFFISYVKPTTDPLVKLKHALETITQNEIKTDGHTLEIQTNSIQELATIEREMQSIIKYEGSFLGQKKLLILKGNFKAKAGFDLNNASEFSIINGEVSGTPPKAEILSVELLDYEIYHSQDAAFNKLTPKDQEAATHQLLNQARLDALNSDLRLQAELQFQQRLDDLMDSPSL